MLSIVEAFLGFSAELTTEQKSGGEFGRPIVAPPGMPADRVKILREAFMKARSDPDLLAEVKKKNLEADPTGGEELAALAKEVLAGKKSLGGSRSF
jgi:tripartite-type tricarboxylate transporter receptor subunit TctC